MDDLEPAGAEGRGLGGGGESFSPHPLHFFENYKELPRKLEGQRGRGRTALGATSSLNCGLYGFIKYQTLDF